FYYNLLNEGQTCVMLKYNKHGSLMSLKLVQITLLLYFNFDSSVSDFQCNS
ncbi:hypothetical protein L9F63_007671, partial [Diploptera punctata]